MKKTIFLISTALAVSAIFMSCETTESVSETKTKSARVSMLRQIPASEFSASDYNKKYTNQKASVDKNGAEFIYQLIVQDRLYGDEQTAQKAVDEFKIRSEQIMARIAKNGNSYEQNTVNGKFTEERKSLHEKIINAYLSKENISKYSSSKPTFAMLGGRSGSGKSWFTNKVLAKEEGRKVLLDDDNYLRIDPDDIKNYLNPENPPMGWHADVDYESRIIASQILNKAKDLKLNIIYDENMSYDSSNPTEALDLAKSFKTAGYIVNAYYVYLPVQESTKRGVMRFAGTYTFDKASNKADGQWSFTGRFVPIETLLSMQDNEISFDMVITVADDWYFYDNQNTDGYGMTLISKKN